MFPVSFNGRRRGRCVLVPVFSTLLAAFILKTTAAAAQNAAGPQQVPANKRVGAAAGAAPRHQKASDWEDGRSCSGAHKSAATVGAAAARGDTHDSAE